MTRTNKIGIFGLIGIATAALVVGIFIKSNPEITNVSFCPRGHQGPTIQMISVKQLTNAVGVVKKQRVADYYCNQCRLGFSVTNILSK